MKKEGYVKVIMVRFIFTIYNFIWTQVVVCFSSMQLQRQQKLEIIVCSVKVHYVCTHEKHLPFSALTHTHTHARTGAVLVQNDRSRQETKSALQSDSWWTRASAPLLHTGRYLGFEIPHLHLISFSTLFTHGAACTQFFSSVIVLSL